MNSKNNPTSIPVPMLEKIRERLPRNWRAELPDKSGVSVATIENVLYGKTARLDVLEMVISYIEEKEKEAKSIISKINNF